MGLSHKPMSASVCGKTKKESEVEYMGGDICTCDLKGMAALCGLLHNHILSFTPTPTFPELKFASVDILTQPYT